MSKEIEITFNPVENSELDEIEIKISSRFSHFLKKVKASDETAIVKFGTVDISRYLVKTFIRSNFQEFLILWSTVLLDNLSIKTLGTYSDYINSVKKFQESNFSTLISEIHNYKRHTFQCDIDNIDNDSNDNQED